MANGMICVSKTLTQYDSEVLHYPESNIRVNVQKIHKLSGI